MKITVTTPPTTPKKLIAVIEEERADGSQGLFLPATNGGSIYVNTRGEVSQPSGLTLKKRLELIHGRKPVYEGESITLQF